MFSHTPVCLDAPICVALAPICLDTPMFGWPLYVWMPSCVALSPHMFGHHPYVWIPLLCLDTHHMFGCPPYVYHWAPYVWTPPICLDAPCMFGCPPHMCSTASNTFQPVPVLCIAQRYAIYCPTKSPFDLLPDDLILYRYLSKGTCFLPLYYQTV